VTAGENSVEVYRRLKALICSPVCLHVCWNDLYGYGKHKQAGTPIKCLRDPKLPYSSSSPRLNSCLGEQLRNDTGASLLRRTSLIGHTMWGEDRSSMGCIHQRTFVL